MALWNRNPPPMIGHLSGQRNHQQSFRKGKERPGIEVQSSCFWRGFQGTPLGDADTLLLNAGQRPRPSDPLRPGPGFAGHKGGCYPSENPGNWRSLVPAPDPDSKPPGILPSARPLGPMPPSLIPGAGSSPRSPHSRCYLALQPLLSPQCRVGALLLGQKSSAH